jgi:hypothetical protein
MRGTARPSRPGASSATIRQDEDAVPISLFVLVGIPALLLLLAVGAVPLPGRRARGGDPVAAPLRRARR